jgi:hypothetical protein
MTTKRFSFDTCIERGDAEIELRVVYSMIAGSPPHLYGDYPHPGDPDEFEIVSVKSEGKPFSLTDAEESLILERCQDHGPEDWAEDYATEMDWRAQDKRDRLMMGE